MLLRKHRIPAVFILLLCITSCAQNMEQKSKTDESKKQLDQPINKQKPHPFGGWYCPDNLLGFPPVNAKELATVPVVNGRLPTKKETRNGTSLMYFDTTEFPDAKALNINLPQLARYYSENTHKNELVIIIQAVTVQNDTIVGFRYLNGGNGSSWMHEVTFLSDTEVEELGATPFVSGQINIHASPEKIWEVITNPKYAKILGEIFDENAFVESEWKENSKVYFKYEPNTIVSTGNITNLWENTYIQIDYNFNGYHYAEKFLLQVNEENNSVDFRIACGPYTQDFEAQQLVWKNWLKQVKEISEAK